jgi:hypothetical protein
MFDWRFLRGVAVAVAILVILGIFVALPLLLNVRSGLVVHAPAAIRLN